MHFLSVVTPKSYRESLHINMIQVSLNDSSGIQFLLPKIHIFPNVLGPKLIISCPSLIPKNISHNEYFVSFLLCTQLLFCPHIWFTDCGLPSVNDLLSSYADAHTTEKFIHCHGLVKGMLYDCKLSLAPLIHLLWHSTVFVIRQFCVVSKMEPLFLLSRKVSIVDVLSS